MYQNALSTAHFTAQFLGLGLSHTIPAYLRYALRNANESDPEQVRARIREWAQCLIAAVERSGVRVECMGQERIPDTPCIFASGHSSMLEVFIILATRPDVSFVMNQYADLPLLGTLLRMAGTFILPPRGTPRIRKRLIQWGKREISLGRSLAICPEGRILLKGEKRELKPGVYYLFRALQLPVVPVEVDTGTCWSPESEYWWIPIQQGTARMTYKPPIYYGEMSSRSKFMRALSEQIRPAA